MNFIDGCACHVWAIDGYVNERQAAAVNNDFATESNKLLLKNPGKADKNKRVEHLGNIARKGQTVASCDALLFGGWQNDTDAAPEHMWLVYDNWIYDTMPGSALRRKSAGNMRPENPLLLHPPSETRPFSSNRVGFCNVLLTENQKRIIDKAVWEGDEYTPPDS